MLTAFLLCFGIGARAGNVVTIGTASGAPDEEVVVSVSLTNTDAVSTLQVAIPLNEQLTFVGGSASLSSRCSNHNVTAGVKDGTLNIMVYSIGFTAIGGQEGEVVSFRLKLGNQPTTIALAPSKVILADTEGNNLEEATAMSGSVSIRCAKAQYNTTTIDFGSVPIRSTYTRNLTVTNVGNEPLEVTGLQFNKYPTDFSSTTTFPFTVNAGGSASINITYAPQQRGTVSETVKVLCNSISKLNNITLKAQPFAVNELHLQPASGIADETVTVSMTMNNMDAISGFQFEFTLPSQLEYVPNSFTLSDRKQDHTIVTSTTNGVLRIICYSPADKPFNGEDGELATMQLKLTGRNSTNLKASKCVLTATIDNQVTNVCSADYGATITIRSPRLSASNSLDMGRTPVTSDAVKTLSIRNNGNAPLVISRVLFDNDAFFIREELPLTIEASRQQDLTVVYPSITEGDFSTTMQIYSNDPEQRLWNVTVTGNRFAPNYFEVSTADIAAFDKLNIDVAVSTYDPIVGMQFDLTYPGQYYEAFSDNYIVGPRAQGMTVTWRQIDTNTLRFFCYFISDGSIEPGDGKVMSLLLRPKNGSAPTGEYTVKASKIKLATNEMADKYAGQDVTTHFNVNMPASPNIFHDEGEYREKLTVGISYPVADAEIYYSTGNGFVQYSGPFEVSTTTTVEAYAMKGGTESARASKTFTISSGGEGPSVDEGYYSIKNNSTGKFVKVTGIRSLELTSDKDTEAGTVVRMKATDGKVEMLRSQGFDIPQYISRAMRYVPDVVNLVVEKFNLSGPGTLLGTTGTDKILEKFNESVDLNLHLEEAGNSQYRIYAMTPSMAPVVNFYIENKEKADYKLTGLEQAVNDAIAKVVNKIGMGESLKNSFSLHMVWERMADETLTEPMEADDESKLKFLQEVLTSEQLAWQFAYQTATFYMEFLEGKEQFQDFMESAPEYERYWERIKEVRPMTKYYLVQKDDKVDMEREDAVGDEASDVWTIESRNSFTIGFPEENRANGKFYTTLYTDFGYTLPEGVKAIKVTGVDDNGFAIMEGIGTEVSAQTPVMLESLTSGDISISISEVEATPAENLLKGNDYLIRTYNIYESTIAALFDAAQSLLGEATYDRYFKEYEHLKLRNAGLVNNKYFFGLENQDLEKCLAEDEYHCVVRSLGVENGRIGFYENWDANANRAFLVSEEPTPIFIRIIGDVNKDGFVTIADVTALVNIILGKATIENDSDKYDFEAADVNADNFTTIADVTALVNIILGKN